MKYRVVPNTRLRYSIEHLDDEHDPSGWRDYHTEDDRDFDTVESAMEYLSDLFNYSARVREHMKKGPVYY